MLSVRFTGQGEWWASSGAFEDLFSAACQAGSMPSKFAELQHIVVANGGLDLEEFLGEDVGFFEQALLSTARAEVYRLEEERSPLLERKYGQSLNALIKLFNHVH